MALPRTPLSGAPDKYVEDEEEIVDQSTLPPG